MGAVNWNWYFQIEVQNYSQIFIEFNGSDDETYSESEVIIVTRLK